MATSVSDLIVCQDLAYLGPGRRCVVLDLRQQTVTFENCFITSQFLSTGGQSSYRCRFDEIVKVTDFLVGDSKGSLFRGLMFLRAHGTDDLRSMFVYTRQGNARVFAQWNGFDSFRATLLEKCKPSRNGYGIDNPNMAVVYAFVLVLLIVGLIWFLI